MENKMDLLANEVRTKNLDHLGLVAATIDDLGIVEKIDAEVKISEQSSMTIGQRVKAMILNGLGFTNYRLYMVAKFFETKPVDRLFSENFNSEQINDDALGRCLDKIYEKGTTSLYAKIAFEIAQEQGLLEKGHRHDSTTLTVYGDYENNANNKGINITYGHSKDHRPDLKQVTMMLTMTKSNHFPLWMSALHGNASDKKSFQEIDKKVRAFRKQLKLSEDALVVGDSALYCSELLERSKEDLQFFWLTRGLMQKLERSEIQAVMAHELSHIRHADIKLTLTASVLSNIILIVLDLFFYNMLFSRDSENNGGGNALVIIIIVARYVLPLITVLLLLLLSRTREYMADAGSVELIRDNHPLARALLKIEHDHQQNVDAYSRQYGQTKHEDVRKAAYIFDPFGADVHPIKSLSSMFSTHPSTDARLKALGFQSEDQV